MKPASASSSASARPPARAVPYPMLGAPQGAQEAAAVAAVLTGGGPLQGGPARERFERELRDYLGVDLAGTTPSCTSALTVAARALDLRPGDEVIASSLTYQATVAPLLGTGVTVRFADIDPHTLNIDPASVRALLRPATRAIFLVHYGGGPADMPAIMDIAARAGVAVVEDAAHALGARLADRMAGTWGIGCFSFGSGKNLTTLGQGGAICVREPSARLSTRIEQLRSLEPVCDFRPVSAPPFPPFPDAPDDGLLRHEKNAYHAAAVDLRGSGLNCMLGEPACAAGSVQLGRIGDFTGRRRRIAERIDEAVASFGWARVHRVLPGAESSRHLYALLLDDPRVDRERYVKLLAGLGVEVQLRYFPIHLLPEWRCTGSGFGDCPVTEEVWFRQLVNLPIYPMLADWQIDYVIEAADRAHRLITSGGSVRATAAELVARFGIDSAGVPVLTHE